MRSTGYDYTRYVLRTDPVYPPTTAMPHPDSPALLDFAATQRGELTATVPVILGIWTQVGPDPAALAAMRAVLFGFVAHARSAGLTSWGDVTFLEAVTGFVRDPHPMLSDDARRLRKNTIHAAYLALTDAGLHEPFSPAEGIDPVPAKVRNDERGTRLGNPKTKKLRRSYTERVHIRPASHDEMLLVRLACRFVGSSRALHLPDAAVAICSASATSLEAPQLLWGHLDPTGARPTIRLAGRAAEPGREETAISVRTVELDEWSVDALTAWQRERSMVRPVDLAASVLYIGSQSLTSNSAQVSADQQVRKALEVADLRREPGLTAGSLRLWAAAKVVTSFAALADGAAIAGVDPLTLHRHVTQQGDRGLHLSH